MNMEPMKDRSRVDAFHVLIDNYLQTFAYLQIHAPNTCQPCVINVGRQAGHSMAIVERLKYNDIWIAANGNSKKEYERMLGVQSARNIISINSLSELRVRELNLNKNSVIYIDNFSYLDKDKIIEALTTLAPILARLPFKIPQIRLG